MKQRLKDAAQKFLSAETRRKIVLLTRWPPVGWVRFGSLRRLAPIDPDWGYTRGTPIDRYYIEKFLGSCKEDIRGRVLEFKDNSYTMRFGENRVTQSDVIHKVSGNPQATFVADISSPNDLPGDAFDCIICTQTLQFIYDVRPAIRTLHRILSAGGTLLVTIPVVSQISATDMKLWGDYWRFTSLSAHKLFGEVFPSADVQVQTYGNVMASAAFLYGLSINDLKRKELDFVDPNYEFIISVRAVKSMGVDENSRA